MATILTHDNATSDLAQNSNNLENLVGRLYSLKKEFEAKYYEGRSCEKYDRARDFNIRINLALYHAHKMKRKVDLFEHKSLLSTEQKASLYFQKFNQISGSNYSELEKELDFLGNELVELIR